MSATREFIIKRLYDRGIIVDSGASIESLTGGVSSDIFVVDDGQHRIVVKMALDTLKVNDEWRADIRRNLICGHIFTASGSETGLL